MRRRAGANRVLERRYDRCGIVAEDRLLKLLPNQGDAESAPPIGADTETAVVAPGR